MRIALIGSTGLAGRMIQAELLDKGHSLKILQRKNIQSSEKAIRIINGNAFNKETLSELISDCDVVINTIGQLKNEESFYAPITSDIIKIMKDKKITRYIGITGASVRLDGDKWTILGILGNIIMKFFYPLMMKDKYEEISILKESGINWTMIRLPMIKAGSYKGKLKIELNKVTGSKIFNKQIAEFIARIIETNEFMHSFPIISQ